MESTESQGKAVKTIARLVWLISIVRCPLVPRLRSVSSIQEDVCEARVEACVDDVSDDDGTLASRPCHVTDSENGSYLLGYSKYKEGAVKRKGFPNHMLWIWDYIAQLHPCPVKCIF